MRPSVHPCGWRMERCGRCPSILMFPRKSRAGQSIALRDAEGVMLAVLQVEEIWQADKLAEAQMVFGTTNPEHPGVGYLAQKAHSYYLGGRLEGLQLPTHYDFRSL